MDPSTFEVRASKILTGLGFDKKTIHKKTKDMSGGWRMRVALAKALFVKPSLLLLDDPTGMPISPNTQESHTNKSQPIWILRPACGSRSTSPSGQEPSSWFPTPSTS